MNVSFVISLIRCYNRCHYFYIRLALSETAVSKMFTFLSDLFSGSVYIDAKTFCFTSAAMHAWGNN